MNSEVADWFDGNATNLFPLPEKDRAAKLVGLIGGPEQVLARGREALAGSEFEWAAELADYVLANAIARNYYLSSAIYLLRDLPPH